MCDPGHDPAKWPPVGGQDHAQTIDSARDVVDQVGPAWPGRAPSLFRRCGAAARLAACVGLGAAALPAPSSHAADIRPSTSAECKFRLNGPIELGDRDKLEKLSKASRSSSDLTLCLNSPGGEFGETLRLMDLLGEPSDYWETVVDRAGRCEAECAFVFMAGRYTELHAINGPRRRLHVGGTLRFRLPVPPAGEGRQSAVAVSDAYQKAVEAFAALVGREKAAYMGPLSILPRSLLVVLGSDPETPWTVETVEQAGWLGIDVIGAPPLRRLTTGMLRQACLNVESWSKGIRSGVVAPDPSRPDDAITTQLHESQYPGTLDPGVTCFASAYRPRSGEVFIHVDHIKGDRPGYASASFLREGVDGNDGIRSEAVGFARNTAGWAVLPPASRLGAVP